MSLVLSWLEPDPPHAYTHAQLVLLLAEWGSTLLNLAFTAAIAAEKRWGWLLGFVASAVGVWLYARTHTWALATLNVYYMVMAVYGWWAWGRSSDEAVYHHRPVRFHAVLVPIGLGLSALAAWSLGAFLNGSYPQADAFITVFSLAATWMMTRKVVENWVYFIVADAVAIWLNWRIGYPIYAVQYTVYIGLSIAGLMRWSRALELQKAKGR
ncbi:MAG TPA: nicotinamide riboside transporter PnuC [Flavobacteriales bacterium]|jgi:nicotinamide mononucleotide transporter|nr:nicotinamide riboside transporter PnuC [Flavobacteriales bacterium]